MLLLQKLKSVLFPTKLPVPLPQMVRNVLIYCVVNELTVSGLWPRIPTDLTHSELVRHVRQVLAFLLQLLRLHGVDKHEQVVPSREQDPENEMN